MDRAYPSADTDILFLMAELFPAIVVQVLRIVPTTVLFNLFRMAAAGNVPWAGALLSLAWVLVWAILFLALVIRQVRRLDRQYEGKIAQTRRLPADQPEAHGRKAPAGRSEEVDESPDTSLPGYVAADGLNAGARIIPDATGNVPQSWWKIIRAIAAKDIRHAIRSKVIAAILLGVAFTGGFNSFLPMLLRARSQPAFAIYDEGRSSILRGLGEREDFRLSSYASREEMEGAVSGSAGLLVGLVIPADFDQRASGGAVVLLDGYISHTADLQKARQWASFLEEQLRQAGQGPVQIRLDGNLLYPSADSLGQAGIIALLLAIVIFTIGVALVPLLFIEEKETHTLEALLVSPAGLAQVVAGKALAGATYGLIAGLALMGLNQRLFTHWGVALLALLLATFFTISIGLLLGLLCNNPTTVGTWGSLLLLALLGLTALAFVDIPGLPLILRQALSWLPGATMLRLFRASMAKEASLGLLWANAAALFAAAALIFSLAYWQIKRIAR